MLKQKEYKLLIKQFEQNNIEGYKEWFDKNINCEIIDNSKLIKGIRLYSKAKEYVVIAVESGVVFRVRKDLFRMI